MALTAEDLVAAPHDHVVQFYGRDDELVGGVARYLAEAIEAGGVAVVIATEAHRRAFADGMAEIGIDVRRARADGSLVERDAGEARDGLLIGGSVAPHRFDKLIGELVREVTAGGRPVRAYGEIVALMWADGYVTAALELEGLWNGLGREADFSLYCAYPRAILAAAVEGGGEAAHRVCRHHSAVVGTDPAVLPPRIPAAPLDVDRTFRWDIRAPARTRRFVVETLVAWGRADLLDDAAVIASELATNAVLHAGGDFVVRLSQRARGSIRVAVHDGSDRLPQPRQPAPLAGSGRGLRLIEAVATDWGVELLPDGKVIWAELGR